MNLPTKKRVQGYIKPLSSFYTLAEWAGFVSQMLELQRAGVDTRGGSISQKLSSADSKANIKLVLDLVYAYYDFQLHVEVPRYELLTTKNVLDHIEDFVNHRYWSFEKNFGHYFPDIRKLKFAFFYSRGDLEPYVLLDDEFTKQLYGSITNPKVVFHYTTTAGVKRIRQAIAYGHPFDISCFTTATRPFFRKESNVVVKLLGNVRAGFRSDIKSFAVSDGRRCCNLFRLDYPGADKNNICYELETCDGEVRTSLWNEYIVTPQKVLEVQF